MQDSSAIAAALSMAFIVMRSNLLMSNYIVGLALEEIADVG